MQADHNTYQRPPDILCPLEPSDGLEEVSDCASLARYLHVDLKTVQGLAQRREIPCRKVGKAYRFFRPAVLAWLCDQTKPSSKFRRRR